MNLIQRDIMKKQILLASFLLCSTVAFTSQQQEQDSCFQQSEEQQYNAYKKFTKRFHKELAEERARQEKEWKSADNNMMTDCTFVVTVAGCAAGIWGLAWLCQKAGINFE